MRQLSQTVLTSSKNRSILEGKNLLPKGANSFLLELTLIQEGPGVQESKQAVTKIVCFVKIVDNLVLTSSGNGSTLKGKCSQRSKFFPFRVDPYSGGAWCVAKSNKRTMMVLYRSPEQTALHTYC